MSFQKHYYILIFIFICSFVFPRRSMEFTSAKTYARVEKNLDKAAEFGLIALEKEPDNAYIPYFLAKEVFMQQKKRDEAGKMFIEALNRPDTRIEKAFRIGDNYIRNVHDATRLFADDFFNYGIDEYNKSDIDGALKRFEVAITLDDMHVRSYIAMSEIYYNEKQNIQEAINYLNQAIDKIDDPETQNQLITTKIMYFRKNKEYEKAINLLEKNTNLGILGKRELFLIYIDNDNYPKAIEVGLPLVEEMIETLPIEQEMFISEAAYNLAICYRNQSMLSYNEIINYINTRESNLEENDKYLELTNQTQEGFENAKEYFETSYDYDSEGSPMTREYRKEMKKMIKQVEDVLLPALDK